MPGVIKWFGQAGYLLSDGGTTLVIDPFFTDSIAAHGFVRAYPSPVEKGGLSVDFAVSTHNHGDHLDIETLRDYVSFKNFYGPTSCVEALSAAGFDASRLNKLNRGESVSAGPFGLSAVFADHTPDSIGVIVNVDGLKLYFTGDTRFHESLFDAAPQKPDVIFICINGKFGNMGWQDAVETSKRFGVKTAIPMHYDMFPINAEDPSLFTSAFDGTGIRSFRLERDKEYEISSLVGL